MVRPNVQNTEPVTLGRTEQQINCGFGKDVFSVGSTIVEGYLLLEVNITSKYVAPE